MAKKAAKPAAKTVAKKPAPVAKAKAAPAKAPAKAAAKTEKAPAKVAAAKAPVAKAAPAKAAKPGLMDKLVKAAKAVVAPVIEAVSNEADTVAEVEAAPDKPTLMLVKAPKAAKPPKEPKAKKTKKVVKTKAGQNAADDEGRWDDLRAKHADEKPQVYDMKATFAAGKPLQHKSLGWGWILSSENDRLEVLFKDGRRMLISNYNPNR